MVSQLLLILVFLSHHNSKPSMIINLSKKRAVVGREVSESQNKTEVVQVDRRQDWLVTDRVQQYVAITHVCAYVCMHGYCGRQIKVWYPRYPCISISVNIIMISIVLVFTTLLSQCLYTAASPLQTEEKEHRCEDLWNIDLNVMKLFSELMLEILWKVWLKSSEILQSIQFCSIHLL